MLYIVLFKRCSFQNNFLWCHSVWNLWTSYSEPIRFAVILCIRNRSVLLWSFVFGTILFCCDPLYSEQFSFAMILCIQNHSVLLWSFVFGTIQFVVILCIWNHSVCCDPLYLEPFSLLWSFVLRTIQFCCDLSCPVFLPISNLLSIPDCLFQRPIVCDAVSLLSQQLLYKAVLLKSFRSACISVCWLGAFEIDKFFYYI